MSGITRRLSRSLPAALVVGLLAAALFGAQGRAQAAPKVKCTPRLLVVSAFPAEIGHLLDATAVQRTIDVDGRQFWVGTLAGNNVVLALTGIGPVNADKTTRTAFDTFTCANTGSSISGVVFSGVAGVKRIGDVAVPTRWTPDARKTWIAADPTMLAVAQQTAPISTPKLERTNPLGDPACACTPTDLIKTVTLSYQPDVTVGGDGETSDPFAGRALPCAPNGGDIFGCEPCKAQKRTVDDAQRFVPGILPFIPNFFFDYLKQPQQTDTSYAAQDEETAAVGGVATSRGVPFIGFRAGSDGAGDPLMLPGFPFQFFFYKQIAADNAATATMDFLRAWATTKHTR
jgi:nucleoside phosphorylase